MRLVHPNKHNPQELEVAWMWLPTFLGQNTLLLNKLDKELNAKFPGPLQSDNCLLDQIHTFIIDYLCSMAKVPGLRHYLEAVSYVGVERPEP